jgi:hypothetical protein
VPTVRFQAGGVPPIDLDSLDDFETAVMEANVESTAT